MKLSVGGDGSNEDTVVKNHDPPEYGAKVKFKKASIKATAFPPIAFLLNSHSFS